MQVPPVNGTSEIHGDQILVGDKLIGISSGHMYSPAYRATISRYPFENAGGHVPDTSSFSKA